MIYKKLNKNISQKGLLKITTASDVDKAYVDNLDKENVKLTGDQNIYGSKTIKDHLKVDTKYIFMRGNEIVDLTLNPKEKTSATCKEYVDKADEKVKNDVIKIIDEVKETIDLKPDLEYVDIKDKEVRDYAENRYYSSTRYTDNAINRVKETIDLKQDKLIAGDNITITGNTISSSGVVSEWELNNVNMSNVNLNSIEIKYIDEYKKIYIQGQVRVIEKIANVETEYTIFIPSMIIDMSLLKEHGEYWEFPLFLKEGFLTDSPMKILKFTEIFYWDSDGGTIDIYLKLDKDTKITGFNGFRCYGLK